MPSPKPIELRNQRIYQEYLDLIKNDPRSRFTSKRYYFSLLAEKWYLSEKTIDKIIYAHIKMESDVTA